jgi:hypothetical protein
VNNLKRQPAVDPAVADLLSEMDRKKRLSSLSKAMQRRAKRDAARHKVGLDLPPALHEALKEVAEKEGISVSSLTAFFAKRGLNEYRAGQIDLEPYLRISRSARFEYVLCLEKVKD